MAHDRTFRFAAQLSKGPDGSARSWAEQARRAEDLGYSALLMPDHFGDQLAPVPALAAAAAATSTLRMGALVFCNDYRHPFVLAKEAATLDVLSEGRFELSLGAGWMRSDYDEAGLPYDHPAVRVDRFEEAVKVVPGPAAHRRTVQLPRRRTTRCSGTPSRRGRCSSRGHRSSSAAGASGCCPSPRRHADIVSINVNLREGTGGAETAADATPERTRTKIAWVKEAAGDRFDDLELNSLIGFVLVTDDAAGLAGQMAPAFGIDPADALHVPLALVGTLDEMAEELEWRRAEYGISYWSIESDAWETLGPVVSKLAGTMTITTSTGWEAIGIAARALRRARLHHRRAVHRARAPRAPARPARVPDVVVRLRRRARRPAGRTAGAAASTWSATGSRPSPTVPTPWRCRPTSPPPTSPPSASTGWPS